jgi:large subunit ribosomal protein L25
MITLNAEARDVKVNPKMIRRTGNIPAVYYGSKHAATSITVNKIAFVKAYQSAGESTIISLKTPTGTIDALIHDVALDPIIGDAIHVDFYIVAKDHKIEVDVPVEFTGTAPAEKLGGVIVKVLHEIRIEALPGKLPPHFIVDLAKLTGLDSHITIGDLAFPDGVRSVMPLSEIVAGVTGAQVEKEDAPTTIDMSSIEVAKKGKKEEEEVAE